VNNSDQHCPAVELQGVSKRFGSRVILDDIHLSIGRGEVLVLLGASGSGKSTLLKIVSGIESPDSGRVLLAGQDCTHKPPYRRGVHTVFQNYALFPHLDVAGNVAFPLHIAGVAKAECNRLVAEALEWVKLDQHARRRVSSLSGGERQRVALARALVDSPECVLLDEPLSALDPHLRAGTLELLQAIQSRLRTTFLFITHDREEALRLGHRIGVLNQGKLEQIGTPEEVYHQPKTPYVAAFIGKINWMEGNLCRENGHARLNIAGQEIPCEKARTLPAGNVRIGVRPEDVHVGDGGCLAATVTSRQFLGDSVVLQVQLADGSVLHVDQRSPHTAAAPGEQVRIGWDSAAAHVFPVGRAEGAA
jgi:ABC-type Fe3+/spermidine/putrescine transport system ATPase subunit